MLNEAPDPTDLIGQEEQDAAREDRKAHAARVAADDWKWLLADKRGRRLMYSLLARCGVYRLSFDPMNPAQTAFNEGARNIGLSLTSVFIQHAPEDYGRMVKENG